MAVDGETGKSRIGGESAERFESGTSHPAAAHDGDIQPVIGLHDDQATRLPRLERQRRDVAQRFQFLDDTGCQHGAFLDADDGAILAAVKAEDHACRWS